MAILTKDFKQAEYSRLVYAVTLPLGTKFEEVLKPEFWANVAKKLAQKAHIEVTDTENTYFAELFVTSVSPVGAKVKVLRKVQLTEAGKESEWETKDFLVDFTQKDKGRVVRKSDKSVVSSGHNTKLDAKKEMLKLQGEADLT